MNHSDHVALLEQAVAPGGIWADIGAGEGAFTLAIADLLGPGSQIVAVARGAGALRQAVAAVAERYPEVRIELVVADLTRALDLPTLDGLVAANSLHFVPRGRQPAVIEALAGHLRPGGRFVVVEYDAEGGNRWVPYPFRAASWPELATAAGLVDPRPLHRVPSRFLGAIYSAVATRP